MVRMAKNWKLVSDQIACHVAANQALVNPQINGKSEQSFEISAGRCNPIKYLENVHLKVLLIFRRYIVFITIHYAKSNCYN